MAPWTGARFLWLASLLAALTFPQTKAFDLTTGQLFNFAPLPTGSLPNEPLFTPDLRACVFANIQRSLSNLTLSDSQTNARFLRLIFHDCASGGCNGSIMKLQEQKAFVNTFLSGYDKVQIVKAAADAACGSNLSYADTIVAGAFIGVYLSGGPNVTQYVRLGRADTDGLDDPERLPSAFTLNDDLIKTFAVLGLNVEELVALSGAHTLGKATCANVTPRIGGDPYADPQFLYGLTNQCRTLLQQLSMDLSPTQFDTSYYKVMQTGKGILQTDEGLYAENTTRAYTQLFASNQTEFFSSFAVGLLKMSLIGLRPPSVSNVSAGLDRTTATYLFRIEDLQAALDAQIATPNSQVVVTSILPADNNPDVTNVTFWVVPAAINYNGTIPLQEAAVIVSSLNATSADPSKLILNSTGLGPVQGLQILSSPLANVTLTSQTFSLASFTLAQTLATLQQNLEILTSQIARALGLRPSETLGVTLSTPVGASGTLVTLTVTVVGGPLSSGSSTGQQRVGDLQSLLGYAVGNHTLVNETQFGIPENVLRAPENGTTMVRETGASSPRSDQGAVAPVGNSALSSVPGWSVHVFISSVVLLLSVLL
ncbi:hypothetical protein KFL_000040130 [Klebsormidium nitens]|uniref:Plant heme peroxidase family profile domain-containing protein n=1 Tax=Klebsormidium nitens TaxID=105231 RepID=A0A1Y1HJS6_KLENI|nr:hypothetical protein KFL_000040130 [Klebsormidium nitens]|eukprot:GAQ77812.1 hypothetical protein KFL_000040130 [Klebsormidium nitens]